MSLEEGKTKQIVESHVSQTASMSAIAEFTPAVDESNDIAASSPSAAAPKEHSGKASEQCPHQDCVPYSTAGMEVVAPEISEQEPSGSACAQDSTSVDVASLKTPAVGTYQPDSTEPDDSNPPGDSTVQNVSTAEATHVLAADLEDDVVNLAVDTTLDNVTNMISCDMASAPGNALDAANAASNRNTGSGASQSNTGGGGFDDMADRAVVASEYLDNSEETEVISRKSERIVRPSMAVRSSSIAASFSSIV